MSQRGVWPHFIDETVGGECAGPGPPRGATAGLPDQGSCTDWADLGISAGAHHRHLGALTIASFRDTRKALGQPFPSHTHLQLPMCLISHLPESKITSLDNSSTALMTSLRVMTIAFYLLHTFSVPGCPPSTFHGPSL